MALGFVAGFWTASRRALRVGMHMETVLDLGPWLIIGTIAGARTLYVITFWKEQFAANPFPEIFMVQHGGLVFYGGLVGASLGTILYSWNKKVPLWKLADVLTPSIALGSAFGRIGCFMNGCCYGSPCTLPWAVHYPADNPTYPQGVHPTQLYDALLNFVLYLGLVWVFRHKRRFDGQIFALFLMGYAVFRSIAELFRGDYPVNQHFLGGIATPAQMVSLVVLLSGVMLFWLLPRPVPIKGK